MLITAKNYSLVLKLLLWTAFHFPFQKNFGQMLQLPIYINVRLGNKSNILEIFLTSSPSPYIVKLSTFIMFLGLPYCLCILFNLFTSYVRKRPSILKWNVFRNFVLRTESTSFRAPLISFGMINCFWGRTSSNCAKRSYSKQ